MFKHKCESSDVYCDLCTSFAIEDANHIIMQCPSLNVIRTRMYAQIRALELSSNTQILSGINDMYALILGKVPTHLQHGICIDLLKIIAQNVHDMYRKVMTNREGIG